MQSISTKGVLTLNANYLPIGVITYEKAIYKLYSRNETTYPVMIRTNSEGELEEFDTFRSMRIWELLKPKEGDTVFKTASGNEFIVPKIVIFCNYKELPYKSVYFPTKKNIWKRDGNRCGYSGRLLSQKDLSVDHIVPKSKGGKDSWENLITCDRLINSQKSDKYLSQFTKETGYKLLFKPEAPKDGLAFNFFESEWKTLIK